MPLTRARMNDYRKTTTSQGEVLRRLQAVGANCMPPSPASAALRPFKLPLACMFDLPQAWKVVAAG